jgi:Protein of unknown function (DUF3618)
MSPENEYDEAAKRAAQVATGEVPPDRPQGESESESAPPDEPEVLREEIAETREELGDTVEALAAKADVKGQAQAKVDERKALAQAKVEEAKARIRQTTQQAQTKLPEPVQEKAGQAQAKAAELAAQAREKKVRVADKEVPVVPLLGGAVALLVLVRLIRRR